MVIIFNIKKQLVTIITEFISNLNSGDLDVHKEIRTVQRQDKLLRSRYTLAIATTSNKIIIILQFTYFLILIEMTSPSTSTAQITALDPSLFLQIVEFFHEPTTKAASESENMSYRCRLCPKPTLISACARATSNLTTHLKRKHPDELALFVERPQKLHHSSKRKLFEINESSAQSPQVNRSCTLTQPVDSPSRSDMICGIVSKYGPKSQLQQHR